MSKILYDKFPVIFSSILAQENADSINYIIASYIVNNLNEIKNIKINSLAKNCNVGIGSISRFCKHIGLSDFNELKNLINSTNLSYNVNPDTYKNDICNGIDMVNESIDMNKINELAAAIKKTDKIACFGLLKAGSVAYNFQSDLILLGKKLYTSFSFKEQFEFIKTLNSNDLLIIFSYTGSYFDYFDKRELQRILKANVWMIHGGSVKSEFVNHEIRFNSNLTQATHPYQLEFISGLIKNQYNIISNS